MTREEVATTIENLGRLISFLITDPRLSRPSIRVQQRVFYERAIARSSSSRRICGAFSSSGPIHHRLLSP
jgi:hypothetical protein